jgi:hypothetical protein
MARYKVLQSVAHGVGHSFTGTRNYLHGDYVMGHLLGNALASGDETLTLDLVAGTGAPASLLRPPLQDVAADESRKFHGLVERHGSDLARVRAARLTVRFDLAETKPMARDPRTFAGPYLCEVVVTDDRGKDYSARFTGVWDWTPPAPTGGAPRRTGRAGFRKPTPPRPWWRFWG